MGEKKHFFKEMTKFIKSLNNYTTTKDGQWSIKGFIDAYKNIYTISCDTKIVSKILEIHIFPKLLQFAETMGYKLVLADHQNYYPDLTFVHKDDDSVKFAVDLKTTYRLPNNKDFCNGFTLGSHGKYFIDRNSKKNIQFPYNEYSGHFCLGIIYTRAATLDVDETRIYNIADLKSITSVIKDFQFFCVEKWKIASDKGGSGNTANIGSIKKIDDVLSGNGTFFKLGEEWFDDYWMNFGKITIKAFGGKTKKITRLKDFIEYRKSKKR